MNLEITEEQMLQIAANAVNASIPMGMGFLHAEDKSYTPEDVKSSVDIDGSINLDYFHGRMVKLYIRKKGENYVMQDGEARMDYQSWAGKYPTYEDLANSITV